MQAPEVEANGDGIKAAYLSTELFLPAPVKSFLCNHFAQLLLLLCRLDYHISFKPFFLKALREYILPYNTHSRTGGRLLT